MSDLEHAELSVLGAVLLTGGRVLDELTLDGADFHSPAHEAIWDLMGSLHAAGRPVEAGVVAMELGRAEVRVDPMLIHRALETVSSPGSAPHYADLVADAALRRRLALAGTTVAELARDGHTGAEVLERAEALVGQAAGRSQHAQVRFMGDTLEHTLDMLEAGPAGVIPTPWAGLNDLLGGLTPGAMYVVGARPSAGKSLVGLHLARTMAAHGAAGLVSLEMTVDEVNMRAIAQDTGVSLTRLTRRNLTERDWQLIADRMEALSAEPLAVLDDTSATLADIRRWARALHRRRPLSGLVVDYLQLMHQDHGDRRDRHVFVSDMSRRLKMLAGELNIPIVVLSQLNRASEGRSDPRPRMSDLRESGSIEQDADVVLLLHRDGEDPAAPLEVIVAKHRNGPKGSVDLTFLGHRATVADAYQDPAGASIPEQGDLWGDTPGDRQGDNVVPMPYKD